MDEECCASSSAADEYGRSRLYKTNGRDQVALREKRRECEVELRKTKREEKFFKNRQFPKEPNQVPNGNMPTSLGEVMHSFESFKHSDILKSVAKLQEMIENGLWTLQTLSAVDILAKLADIYCNRPLTAEIRRRMSKIFLHLGGAHTIGHESNDFNCVSGLVSNFTKYKNNEIVLYDTIQALACFVNRSICYRNTCLDCAIVPELLDLMKTEGGIRLHRFVMWLTTLFCEKLDKYSPEVMEIVGLLDIVAAGIQSTDSMIQTDATAACVYLAEWEPIHIYMKKSQLCTLLVTNLRNNSGNARPTVHWGISMIIQSTNYFTEEMIQAGLFEVLRTFVNVNFMAQEVCFLISNICVEGEYNIERLIKSGILMGVARVMETSEYRARREAAFVFCHCSESTNNEHLAAILDMGVLSAFADMLTVMDANLVSYILDALSNLLNFGELKKTPDGINPVAEKLEEIGGLRKLDFLVGSQCIDIHSKSYVIIERYFENSEEVAAEVDETPSAATKRQHFEDVFSTVMGANQVPETTSNAVASEYSF